MIPSNAGSITHLILDLFKIGDRATAIACDSKTSEFLAPRRISDCNLLSMVESFAASRL